MTAMESALVLIDVQLGLVRGSPPVADAPGLLSRLQGLIARARERKAPIVYVLDDVVAEVGTEEWDVHPAVAPEATDRRVRKEACDVFHQTELRAVLEELGARHLVIAGCKTEFCIDTSCRRAISLGYAVTLVADGHGTSDSDGLPASQIIAHHNRTLNEYGAYVGRSVCEIIVAPADTVQFDRARDVPSSLEQRPLL